MFDPQTKDRAGKKSRILICDGFGTHETLEVLEFCFANNITLCRLPSHTSHKLQPCDISVFGPLKAAYRDEVERLERGGVGMVGKEHFTYLYSPARKHALTARNIRAGWAKAGLFPFNPTRVVVDIPQPIVEVAGRSTVEAQVVTISQSDIPQTPVTPVSSEAVASLRRLIEQDAHLLDETDKQRLQSRLQKLTNATQLSFAERSLLRQENHFLMKINNEAKVRRSTRLTVVGTARVMSYEDLERARVERDRKETEKEAKKAEKKAKKAEKEAKKVVKVTAEAPEPWRAPVARMW